MKVAHKILLGTGTLVAAATLGTSSIMSTHKVASKSVSIHQNYQAVQPDVVLTAATQPTTPIVNGQVSEAFISRFNNAVTLTDNNQYVINKANLPTNASSVEMQELDKLITQSNIDLKAVIAKVPKANIAKVGNSVVVGDSQQTTQKIVQGSTVLPMSLFHEGYNYFHSYWWGYRIGVSKTTLHNLGGVVGSGGAAIAGVLWFIPTPQTDGAAAAISAASAILGFGLNYAPGGIVFNLSPVAGFWGPELQ